MTDKPVRKNAQTPPKNNQIQIDKFSDLKPARVSQELYALERVRWKLSTFSYRLLFALAQNIDYYEDEFFPDLGFPINTIFKYLGLDKTNRDYEILETTVRELMEKGLYFKETKANGNIRWMGLSWITYYSFATDEPLLNIKINPDAKKYLRDLKQYAHIQPKYYLRLSSDYQNWFYPYFKNVVKLGKWRVSIEDLKFALFLNETPSYNPQINKNGTENFLRRIIGIEVSEAAKKENQLAKAAKRKPRPVEWDYVRDPSGNFTGTLATITKLTDINVSASVEKTGRSNTHIIFFLSEKNARKALKQVSTSDSPSLADPDMGRPQQKGKRKSKTQNMEDLFNSVSHVQPLLNPAFAKEKAPRIAVRRFSKQDVSNHAKEMNLSVSAFIELMRLQPDGAGGWFKED